MVNLAAEYVKRPTFRHHNGKGKGCQKKEEIPVGQKETEKCAKEQQDLDPEFSGNYEQTPGEQADQRHYGTV